MEIFFKWALSYIDVGDFSLVDPSTASTIEMRKKAEAHLRSKYPPGLYEDSKICNEILQYLYSFYESHLNMVLPNIATSRWVGEIIFQYEQSGKISSAYKKGKLSAKDDLHWRRNGPLFRQALDFLCEKLCELGEIDKVDGLWQTQIPDFETALICAKGCIEYAGISDYTVIMVPQATSITILPAGEKQYFEHNIKLEVDAIVVEYQIQNNREVSIRDKYLDNSFDPFNYQYHAKHLDASFNDSFGITYSKFVSLISSFVNNSKTIDSYRTVPMALKGVLFSNAAEYNDVPIEIVSTLMGQLILDKTVPRKLWNSRQHNRINRRPFLEFISKGRTVIMWSHSKLSDYASLLDGDITFNKPRPEWNSDAIKSAVTEISRNAGKWFERSAVKQLELLGFQGKAIVDKTFKNFPEIKFDCGEIDYLGFHAASKCLVIFEFKMFETGFDAKGSRQVRDSFLKGNQAYVNKLERKVKWVSTNLAFIQEYLRTELNITVQGHHLEIRSVFVTFYPSLMGLFYTKIPCKSLIQFVTDFKAQGQWPYGNEVLD